MDGCKREMKIKVGNIGEKLNMNRMGWAVVACLFADDPFVCREFRE